MTGVAGGLGEIEEKFEIIGDVRGKGPMLAMELVKDRKTKKPNPEAASNVMKASLSSRLITMKAGLYNNAVRLASTPHHRRRAPGEGIAHPGRRLQEGVNPH